MQDIPYSVLNMLYIVETGALSAILLLSFATSLIYLGCASLVTCCASRELAIKADSVSTAEDERRVHVASCAGHWSGV
jgi:hypothetical protein